MIARVVILLCVLVGSASAEPSEVADEATPAPPARGGVQLVRATATWRWQVVTAPPIARQIGALAVSGPEVIAGRRGAPVAVLGDPIPAPARWPYDLDGGIGAIGKPAADQRIAAAFGVTTFALAAADATLAMLELRLHYQDAVAVWLNGVEVVRQALPRAGTMALGVRSHGPEWETFYIPVAPGLLRLGDNTLAVEVHPSGRRDRPVLAADLVGRRDRGIVRGPLLVDATQTTATIGVETDPNVEAVLEWGIGDARASTLVSPAGRHHRFALTGLAPNTRFGYRIHAGASRSPRFTFHTLPTAGAVLRIGIYGDVRGGHATHKRLVDHMLDEGLDAVAVTGDMVLHGSDDADWQRFFGITAELVAQVPYYPAVGNHDLGWDGADGSGRAEQMFALPAGPPGRPPGAFWYSRDVADVHLVFLDSNAYDRPEQVTWLDADLAAARKRGVRAILALTHDGPYARGYHGGNSIARDRYVPVLARYKVDMIFSGHDHIYQRGEIRGLRYMVSGGGGAPLYGIRCGVPGRPKCKIEDGMASVAREYHYAVVTIGKDFELCVRRPDGNLLEKCVRYKLGR
ncbi:MAG: metallophosphoesterase [Kofleriaceae bacterium]